MGWRETFLPWPALRQAIASARAGDSSGRGAAVRSRATERLTPRTETADRVAGSVCRYCAVGCGQLVYVKDERVVQIEGDPASPVSRGRLCPKGAASKQLVNNPLRETKVRYRRPCGARWSTRAGVALLAVSVVRCNRALDIAGGLALTAGSLFTRLGYFHAGTTSATDPRYTVIPQRERVGEPVD